MRYADASAEKKEEEEKLSLGSTATGFRL